jgi:hypothetical protein
MRTFISVPLVASLLAFNAAQATEGLTAPVNPKLWWPWQIRSNAATAPLSSVSLVTVIDSTSVIRPTRFGTVVSDYYFDVSDLRLARIWDGVRATGGLVVRSSPLGRDSLATTSSAAPFGISAASVSQSWIGDRSNETQAYLGVGYTGFAAKGGWGISADLGLVTELGNANGRSPRQIFGVQGLDSVLTNLRFSPVLQLGVHYAY